MNRKRENPINRTFNYFGVLNQLVPRTLENSPPPSEQELPPRKYIRADNTVSKGTLVALGCTEDTLGHTRIELVGEALERRAAGISDEETRLIILDSERELFELEMPLIGDQYEVDVLVGSLMSMMYCSLIVESKQYDLAFWRGYPGPFRGPAPGTL